MLGACGVALCGFLFTTATPQSMYQEAEAQEPAPRIAEHFRFSTNDIVIAPANYEGYENVIEWRAAVEAKNVEYASLNESLLNKYGKYLSDEEKSVIEEKCNQLMTANTFARMEKIEEELNIMMDDFDSRLPKTAVVSYNYSCGGTGVLTRAGGVNNGPSGKETWYSQKQLPGGGLHIPGRHVREDGVIVDADGYVCVATPQGNKGAIVETSLGTGKVYDTNAGGDSVDIYTNW